MSTRNVLDWLEEAACLAPEAPAFSRPEGSLAWSTVCRKAQAAGCALSERIPRQKPVLILMEKSPECLCVMFGTVYAGCFYTPLDSAMPLARMKLIAEKLQPAAVVYEERFADPARQIAGPALLLSAAEILAHSEGSENPDFPELKKRRTEHIDSDLLYVLFTSGSTGTPKGVAITHRGVIDFVEWACGTLRIPEGARFGSQAPFYFDNSVLDIYCAMRTRSCLYLIPRGDFMFPSRLLKRLREEAIDTLFWVPSALTALARADVLQPGALPGMKRVFFCGETMPCSTLNRWKAVLPEADYVNMYGPTEITDVCTWYRVNRTFADSDSLPIGFPCGNTRVMLVDGEICVTGTCLSPGYYNDPEKTAAAFVLNPLRPEIPERMYRTGDLGEYNDLGELMFLGRRDSQIKRSGYRIELGEIESALQNAPGVELCCCYYDSGREMIVAAYTGGAEDAAVKAVLKTALPKYMLPDLLLRRERLPRTPSGKIDRRELRQEAEREHLIH